MSHRMQRVRTLLILFLPLVLMTSTFQTSNSHHTPRSSQDTEGNRELPSPAQQQLAALYPQMDGFPVETIDWIERCSPTVADMDNDGHNELLVGDYRGRVYAWSANGAARQGYPLTSGGHIIGHLALADLDGDADLEIVAGVGAVDTGDQGHVFAWHHDGTLLSGWPQNVARFGDDRQSKISTVALADIDADPQLEIIAATNNNNFTGDFAPYVPNLYAWNVNGALVDGDWPVEDPEDAGILGTVTTGDLDGDGQTDVVVARDYHRVFAYDGQGNHLPGWPVRTFVPPDGVWNEDPRIVHRFSAPTLADLNLDGSMEYIVAGFRRPPDSTTMYNNDLLVFQPDGTRMPDWEWPAGGSGVLESYYLMQQAPAIADLDDDAQLEIVVPTLDGWIRAYNVDKTLLWQFNYAQGAVVYSSEPVIGDVDDDGLPEIVFGAYDPAHDSAQPVGVWILEHDGTPKAGTPLAVKEPGVYAAPTLDDLDDDGDLDIVAATSEGRVYAWDTPAPFVPQRLPWPVARHDLQRSGVYTPIVPSLALSTKEGAPSAADQRQTISYTIDLVRTGPALTTTVQLTDTVPSGLSYVAGSLDANSGDADASQAPTLRWTGNLSSTDSVRIVYEASVTTPGTYARTNTAHINDGRGNQLALQKTVILNGEKSYLPLIYRNSSE